MEKVLCERAVAWGACGGQTRRRNAVEGLIQSTGGYRVANAAGLVHAAAAAALNSYKKLSFETAFLCFRAEKTAQKSANYAGFLSYYGAHCAII